MSYNLENHPYEEIHKKRLIIIGPELTAYSNDELKARFSDMAYYMGNDFERDTSNFLSFLEYNGVRAHNPNDEELKIMNRLHHNLSGKE